VDALARYEIADDPRRGLNSRIYLKKGYLSGRTNDVVRQLCRSDLLGNLDAPFGYSWPSTFGAAVVAYAVFSLLIWQLSDADVLRRLRRIRQD